MVEQATETVRRWLNVFTEAMRAEAVPDRTQHRIMNRILLGNPDGDERERFASGLSEQQAESIRHALDDTGRGLTQILNAAGFENLEVRWTDRAEETDRD